MSYAVIELQPLDTEACARIMAGEDAQAAAPEIARMTRDAAAAHLDLYAHTGATVPWIGYLAAEDGRVVGVCSFKGPPDGRTVEIAYWTFEPFEGRGVGGWMAGALLAIAAGSGAVDTVSAHTLPGPGASTRILQRLGFAFEGAVEDREDGTVWRWTRRAA